jgi:acetyl-CoA acetyltransferase
MIIDGAVAFIAGGFSITAGNSSGVNDAAAALTVVSSDVARGYCP